MKRIVVLIDGTWNKEGTGADTNVAKLDSGKKIITQAFIKTNATDDIAQHVHYHDGVGSDGDLTQRLLGGAIGLGLKKIIQDVYEFLVSDYAAGDEIYIFGFSRGAYAARALAGLIGASGIQRQKSPDEFEIAWSHYRVAPSVRQQPQTASADDRKTLENYNALVQRQGMSRLRRFLPPQVADLIVASGTEKQLESHRREITALFCDLRGFTGFSESSDPEDVMALLREYHAAIGEIIIKYSGTLERYAGDGVMVIFNDPVPVENPALQAVLMALDMRAAIGALIEKWRDLGHDLGFGIGIAHGFATLGTIGFEGRFDYAAIGTVSNVASRLCDEAKPGQILISPRVRQAVEKAVTVEPVGEFTLKGIRRPMMTYNVLESKPN